MDDFDIGNVIKSLSQHKPLFHSEDDLQSSFADEVRKVYPKAQVQREVPYKNIEGLSDNDEAEYASGLNKIDLYITINDRHILIEFKYKTKPINIFFNNCEYNLSDDGARNDNRYLFLRDLSKLESYIINKYNNHNITEAYAVFITNEKKYQDSIKGSVIEDFELSDGCIKTGALYHKNGRQKVFLAGQNLISWSEYSRVECDKDNIFWVCVVKVINPEL